MGLVHERGIITSAYLCLTPNAEILPKFAYLLLHAYDLQKVFYSLGGGVRQSLKYEELKWLQIPLPPLSEQRAIVAFLDRETTQLDALLERKQRLLELLEEQRRAVISQAVTRGLNPDAPLKDSGVPWLGQVPEEWTVRTIGAVGNVQAGRQRAPHFTGTLRPYLRVANVFDGYIDASDVLEMPFSDDEFKRYLLHTGDILLNEGQSIELVGRPAMYRGEPMRCAFQNTLVRFRAQKGLIEPEFALLVFRLYQYIGQFSTIAKKTTSMAHLGVARFAALPVAWPPVEEQRLIAEHVNTSFALLDALRLKLEQSMERLREYRSALITAAVTGQIDVSGEVN